MLHRLLFGLVAVASLTLVGCAHSPQQLSPQPKLNSPLTAVGQGQPVVVRVADGRPSPVLGTRGGLYPETSAISVSGQDILPKLQAQAEAAVRLLGFTPTAGAYNAPQLTLTLAELKYQSPKEGLYVTEADIAASQVTTIGVNSYLWRASLDALSFMPLLQTDSNGGVIVTDWYANPANPGERVKLTVTILDQDLRADALRVAASRQVNQGGQWVDAPVQAATAFRTLTMYSPPPTV